MKNLYMTILTLLFSFIYIKLHYQQKYPNELNPLMILNNNYDTFRYILCGVFKQEGMYLKEWINHHINLGFHQVILVNNNDNRNDDYDVIEEIKKNKRITIYDKIGCHPDIPKLYEEIYLHNCKVNDWCLFADIDEFFIINVSWSLDYYINVANSHGCSQIKLNWLIYGNNGNIFKTNGTLIERFPKPATKILPNLHVSFASTKPLLKGGMRNIKWKSFHHAIAEGIQGCNGALQLVSPRINNGIFVSPPSYNVSYLAHYFTKSEQEWCHKINRHKKNKYVKNYEWHLYNQANFYQPNIVQTKKINELTCLPINKPELPSDFFTIQK